MLYRNKGRLGKPEMTNDFHCKIMEIWAGTKCLVFCSCRNMHTLQNKSPRYRTVTLSLKVANCGPSVTRSVSVNQDTISGQNYASLPFFPYIFHIKPYFFRKSIQKLFLKKIPGIFKLQCRLFSSFSS